MRVAVLGASGMLGRCVYGQLLDEGHDVVAFVGHPTGWGTVTDLRRRSEVYRVADAGFAWIVNCAGVVKSRSDAEPVSTALVNSALPHWLAERAKGRILHISTDCVFDGRQGGYREDDEPSPVDLYGATKTAGELRGGQHVTIRTSFVGWEAGTERGLLSWFVQQSRALGYANALWSGLSAREVARCVVRILQGPSSQGLYHLSGEVISKHDLLVILRRHLKLSVEIEPVTEPCIDRSLDSSLFRETFGYVPPSWGDMAAELAAERS